MSNSCFPYQAPDFSATPSRHQALLPLALTAARTFLQSKVGGASTVEGASKNMGAGTGKFSRTELMPNQGIKLGELPRWWGFIPRFWRKNGGYLHFVGSKGDENVTFQTAEGSVCNF